MNRKLTILVQKVYEEHASRFEVWRDGKPKNAWINDEGYLCIEYESGRWWHYSGSGENLIFW